MAQPNQSPAARPSPEGEAGLRRLLEGTLGLGAGLILMALVLITCVDVVGRYLLGSPLKGAFEMTEVLVAALVFAALPLTTERDEHVEVDLLAGFAQGIRGRAMAACASLFSAALLLTFAWRLADHAGQLRHDGAVTNALAIPLAPLGYFASLSCLISAALILYRLFRPAGESLSWPLR